MSLRRLAFPIQILISFSLLALLVRDFDWQDFMASLSKISLGFYVWSLLLLSAGQLLYVLKWHIVLRSMGATVSIRRLVEQFFVSLFFNNFLPTNFGGDVAKVWYLGQKVGFIDAGASVFVDRFLSFLAIAAIAVASSWTLSVTSTEFGAIRGILSAVLVCLLIAFVLLIACPTERLFSRERACRVLGQGRADSLRNLMAKIRRVSKQPGVLMWVALLVTSYYLLLTVVYRGFFKLALSNDTDLLPVLAALTGIALLANLPLSVNGIGLREQLHYLLFASMQVPKAAAVAVSVLVFSQLFVLSLIGGALWLRMRLAGMRQTAPAPLVLGLAVNTRGGPKLGTDLD